MCGARAHGWARSRHLGVPCPIYSRMWPHEGCDVIPTLLRETSRLTEGCLAGMGTEGTPAQAPWFQTGGLSRAPLDSVHLTHLSTQGRHGGSNRYQNSPNPCLSRTFCCIWGHRPYWESAPTGL